MERYNPEELYTLAGGIKPILQLNVRNDGSAIKLNEVLFDFYRISVALEEFLKADRLHLSPATIAVARTILSNVDRHLWANKENFQFKPVDSKIYPHVIEEVKQLASTFETHFLGDCMEQDIYVIPAVQAYNTRVLLEQGERLLGISSAAKLAGFPKAMEDIRTAARCLAFDLWTATGFHIARATELLIQEYWMHARGKSTLPAKHGRTWVALCRELQGRPATLKTSGVISKPAVPPAGDQKLVDFLLMIGEGYRNPLVHPEHSLDETDGNLLLEGCKAAMTKILALLP